MQLGQIQPITEAKRVKTFTVSVISAAIGVSTMAAYTYPITHMDKLDKWLAFFLGSSPIITTVLNQIPMIHFLNNGAGGVKKVVLISYVPAIVGASLAAVTAAINDITQVSDFDGVYVSLFAAGMLIGMGSGLFPLTILAQQYATNKYLPWVTGSFGALVDIPSIIFPLSFYYLYEAGINFAVLYSAYAAILGVSCLMSALLLQETPYQQLRQHLNPEEAKSKAIELGQLEKVIPTEKQQAFSQMIKDYLKTLCTMQGVVLPTVGAVIYGGGALYTSTIFPSVLEELGLPVEHSLLVSGACIAAYIATRVISPKLINKMGNANTFSLGAAISCVAAFVMTFPSLPIEALIPMVLLLNIGFGVSLSPMGMLVYDWSKPENKQIREYDSSIMMGLLFSLGTAGQVVLSLASGGLIDAFPENGIQYYFMLMLALLAASAVAVKAVDKCITTHEGYSKCFSLFSNFSQGNNQKQQNSVGLAL